jgi:hypothetical protein
MNLSLLCKWWWKLEFEEGMWQEIVRKKYRIFKGISGLQRKCNTLKFSNFRMLLGRIIKQQFSHNFKT